MNKNNKNGAEPIKVVVFDFGKKLFESEGNAKKVFKELDTFKKKKVF